MPQKRPERGQLPSPDDILAFIAENPGRVSKRDIAKAFGITGSHVRAKLKDLLKAMKDEGRIGRVAGRRLEIAGDLPSEMAVEIIDIDDDGRAIAEPLMWHGDTPPPKIPLLPGSGKRGGPAPGIGDRAFVQVKRDGDGWEGRVRRLMEGESEQIVGVYRQTSAGARIIPTDRRKGRDFHAQLMPGIAPEHGDLVLAEPLQSRRFGPIEARVVRVLGSFEDTDAVSLIAIASAGIPTQFGEDALREAAEARPVTSPGKREDLRNIPLVTVDDADARDHDDAVWAEPTREHGAAWHAIVAIADVAHYVRPGSALDRTAYRRGNSCYFPDRVVPMLPERLSNDLCSLRPGEDRACMAVHLWLGKHGDLIRWKFVRGFMRSAARLTYDEVQAHADGNPCEKTSQLDVDLIANLYGVYAALREARDQRGALDIDRPERKVKMEDGRIAEIGLRHRHDSHKMIEELMIAANVAAASALEERHHPVMYRIHDQPSAEKIEGLREYLQSIGLSLRKSPQLRPMDFAQLLERAAESEFKDAINETVLRSQSQAEYAPENIGHFGLALPRYGHFTSPIRRYADVLVHRSLIRAFHLGEGGLPDDAGTEFDKVGVHITATERRAMRAERDAMDRYLCAYLAERLGQTMTGRITSVGRFGVFVRLDETMADGLLPARRLPGGPFHTVEGRQQLQGNGVVYSLGDAVTVKLVEADPVQASVGFDLVEGGTDAPKSRGPRTPPRRDPNPPRRGRKRR